MRVNDADHGIVASAVGDGAASISARAIGRARLAACASLELGGRLRSRQSARPACRLATDARPRAVRRTRQEAPRPRPTEALARARSLVATQGIRRTHAKIARRRNPRAPGRREPRHPAPARPRRLARARPSRPPRQIADLAWAGQHAKAIELATAALAGKRPRASQTDSTSSTCARRASSPRATWSAPARMPTAMLDACQGRQDGGIQGAGAEPAGPGADAQGRIQGRRRHGHRRAQGRAPEQAEARWSR